MKISLYLSFFFVFSFHPIAYAEWYQMDLNGELIAFGKIAQIDKISVFIVSIPNCGPCKILKEQLRGDKTINLDKVDFYSVNLASRIKSSKLEKLPTATVWADNEKLSSFPYIYIFGPTTSIVSRGNFDAAQIKEIIKQISNNFQNVNLETMLADLSYVKPYSEKKDLTTSSSPSELATNGNTDYATNLTKEKKNTDSNNTNKHYIDCCIHKKNNETFLTFKVVGGLNNIKFETDGTKVIYSINKGEYDLKQFVKRWNNMKVLLEEYITIKECSSTKIIFLIKKEIVNTRILNVKNSFGMNLYFKD
jgi:hypothetical protein